MTGKQAYKLMRLYVVQADMSRKSGLLDIREDTRIVHMANISHPDFPVDKANRWVGFMQGILWTKKAATVDDLREHVRRAKEYTEEECEEIWQAVRNGAVLADGRISRG